MSVPVDKAVNMAVAKYLYDDLRTRFENITAAVAEHVDIPIVETVSGTTPSIIGQPNTRYICGEVSTISITPPANGSIVVRFTSGTTAAVLTVPNTVKFPVWFDATSLDASTIYEIIITDGTYGGVMSWAA